MRSVRRLLRDRCKLVGTHRNLKLALGRLSSVLGLSTALFFLPGVAYAGPPIGELTLLSLLFSPGMGLCVLAAVGLRVRLGSRVGLADMYLWGLLIFVVSHVGGGWAFLLFMRFGGVLADGCLSLGMLPVLIIGVGYATYRVILFYLNGWRWQARKR